MLNESIYPTFAGHNFTIMTSPGAIELLGQIQSSISSDGLNVPFLVETLKKVRPFGIEEEDPTVTKVLRLTYEHLEANETWNIVLEEAEVEEGTEVEDEDEPQMVNRNAEDVTDEERVESFGFLMSLIEKSENKLNRSDINHFKFALLAY